MKWVRHWINPNIIISEGANYICDNGGAWLIDAIASYEHMNKTLINKRKDYELHFWNIKVNNDHSAILTCLEDTDIPPIVTQKIEYTDLPFDLTIYAGNDGPGTPLKIFIPEEY